MGLAEEFAARFSGATRYGIVDATLTRVTPGTRTPGALSAGTNPTSTNHACKAWVRTFDNRHIDGTTVLSSDRVINVLGASISPAAVPQTDDLVTIEGVTYHILDVQRRAGGVLYQCHGRK